MYRHLWCRKLWLIGLALLALSCSTARKTMMVTLPPPVGAQNHPPAEVEHLLVAEGDSSQPQFSSDGKRILFISANRRSHNLAQVYEKQLDSGEERRITYQSGQTDRPTYHPKNDLIVYASTTDEIKERAPRQTPTNENLNLPVEFQNFFEVYTHDLNTLDIQRISYRPGYDGEARFNPDGNLTYTRASAGKSEIIRWNPRSQTSHVIQDLRTKNVSSFTSRTNPELTAWLQWSTDFKNSIIHLRLGKAKPVEVPADPSSLKADLTFSPDGQWLVWAQANNDGLFAIWVTETGRFCPRRLVSSANASLRHPTIAPNMKTLAYSRVDGGGSRIAWRTFEPTPATCPQEH